MPELAIEQLVVKADRVEALVRVGQQRFTTPQLIEACLKEFPHLALHTCLNDEGPTFGAVMDHTTLPHLLEHLVIEQQTLQAKNLETTFVGTTQFTAEDPNVACVNVSFETDVVCLAAFKRAAEFLNSL